MSRRRDNWGFPRWRGYGADAEPVKMRLCDYQGCDRPGEYPAPKSPLSDDKWWFCVEHVSAYNRNWNFFTGMSKAEAEKRAADDFREAAGFQNSGIYGWGGPEDRDGVSDVERQAYAVLELEPGADEDAVRRQYRRLAKKYHPDTGDGGEGSEDAFHRLRAAYEILKLRLTAQA